MYQTSVYMVNVLVHTVSMRLWLTWQCLWENWAKCAPPLHDTMENLYETNTYILPEIMTFSKCDFYMTPCFFLSADLISTQSRYGAVNSTFPTRTSVLPSKGQRSDRGHWSWPPQNFTPHDIDTLTFGKAKPLCTILRSSKRPTILTCIHFTHH